MTTGRGTRILLSAQSLTQGNSGVAAVARLTAASLSESHAVTALACHDEGNYAIGPVSVRGFSDRRVPFVIANALASRRATHVIYDHAGTARAHLELPLLRIPHAIWLHGWELWEQPRADYLRAIRAATIVLANSAYTAERAAPLLRGIDVKICPLATPADRPPSFVPAPGGPPTVMLLGRVDELFAKGHDLLIDVWPLVRKAVPDARLMFVGGGSALGRLRALVAASPARDAIEIAGFVPDAALGEYWRRAHVFVMPGFAEGFGLVYAEAMRRSLPVIASTDDGGQEVNVDGVTGFNVARSDKGRLIDVLVMLLRDRDRAAKMGAAAHTRWLELYTFSGFKRRFATATSAFLSC